MKASKLITKEQRTKEWGNYIILKKVLSSKTTFEKFLINTSPIKNNYNGKKRGFYNW